MMIDYFCQSSTTLSVTNFKLHYSTKTIKNNHSKIENQNVSKYTSQNRKN